jgi:hypothetical protein
VTVRAVAIPGVQSEVENDSTWGNATPSGGACLGAV